MKYLLIGAGLWWLIAACFLAKSSFETQVYAIGCCLLQGLAYLINETERKTK